MDSERSDSIDGFLGSLPVHIKAMDGATINITINVERPSRFSRVESRVPFPWEDISKFIHKGCLP